MQKALTQMNIQLANVISDVVGETGQKILRAIVAGERDGQVLAADEERAHPRQRDEIAKSLQGNWRAEHLFALKQALGAFDFCRHATGRVRPSRSSSSCKACRFTTANRPKARQRGRARNAPKFDLRTQLFKMCGVDLTRIDGIDVTTALAVISEIGADMSRFATIEHFASLARACVRAPRSPAARS